MFTDGRSRRVVFLAHCLLNQNAISDGTAEVPAAHREILRTVLDARVGVVQRGCGVRPPAPGASLGAAGGAAL